MEPLEMLVAVDARMEEVLAAATRQLQQVGKGGSSVTVLEFGGRALRPSDSLQHLMRVVSERTRNAWVSRERPLCLRGRLSQEDAALGGSPNAAVATGAQPGGMGEAVRAEAATNQQRHTAQE